MADTDDVGFNKRPKMMRRKDVEMASNCCKVEIARHVFRAVLIDSCQPIAEFLEHAELLNTVVDIIRLGGDKPLLTAVKRVRRNLGKVAKS